MIHFRHSLLLGCATLAIAAATAPAWAQSAPPADSDQKASEVDEVVVTAERRTQSLARGGSSPYACQIRPQYGLA